DHQRQATKEAGQVAGLNVLRIVNEPTAAALAHGVEGTVLVFHLGGGSLAATVVEIGDGVATVRAGSGVRDFGGDDWHDRLVQHLARHFVRTDGINLTRDRIAMQRLGEAAEAAKIELSAERSTTVDLPYMGVGGDGRPRHLESPISRTEFEQLTFNLPGRCAGPFHQAITEARVDVSDLDHVVLSGGATRMPAITGLVRRLTGGREPNPGLPPDEVVALGAGLQAASLRGETGERTSARRAAPPGSRRRPASVPVFLSYARADADYARGLAEHLEASGIPVWWDQELTTGPSWVQEIERRIDACTAFLVVLTPEALQSRWVRAEIHRASEAGKEMIPLMLRTTPMPLQLQDAQYEDVRHGRLPGARLVAAVSRLITDR
ncbi:Hsp70 family protein, partial [Cryptosporangium sp. NPDC051539]|uniref:Hsp70 family protein n=1 Tax=Cryptosporangium sp. NPDC051539 TaxID=3363962 RepID=UPI0037AC14BD